MGEEVDEIHKEVKLASDAMKVIGRHDVSHLIDRLFTEVERLRRENDEYAERLLKYITPTAKDTRMSDSEVKKDKFDASLIIKAIDQSTTRNSMVINNNVNDRTTIFSLIMHAAFTHHTVIDIVYVDEEYFHELVKTCWCNINDEERKTVVDYLWKLGHKMDVEPIKLFGVNIKIIDGLGWNGIYKNYYENMGGYLPSYCNNHMIVGFDKDKMYGFIGWDN